ncbi:MAG: hypothetical protein JSS35_20490 [Proteobacteria bacterium]|nr:hypothetical protein [Pseudomonadota bacterium]
MKTLLLAAGAAALALSASSALAGPGKNAGRTVAGPKQPIPYAELDSYMKASPKTRMSKDWWSGQGAESTANAGANASATTSATMPKDTSTTAPK